MHNSLHFLMCFIAQSCQTHCNPINCSLPGSSVDGILQARILEWVSMPSSRGSSQPRDWTQVSRLAGGFFAIRAPRETPSSSQSCIIIQKGCFGIATLSTSWLGTENTRHLAGGRTDSPKGVMTFIVHHVWRLWRLGSLLFGTVYVWGQIVPCWGPSWTLEGC